MAFAGIQIPGEVGVRQSHDAVRVRIAPGEDGGSRRAALGRGTEVVLKENPLLGEAVEVWRLHAVHTVAVQVLAEIVAVEQQDVGPRRRGGKRNEWRSQSHGGGTARDWQSIHKNLLSRLLECHPLYAGGAFTLVASESFKSDIHPAVANPRPHVRRPARRLTSPVVPAARGIWPARNFPSPPPHCAGNR